MTTHSGSHHIIQVLRAKMMSGEWPGGTRLPSERNLAKTFGVARKTLQRALTILKTERLIEGKSRSGVYVRITDETPLGSSPLQDIPQTRHEQIARSLMKDISIGVFRVGDFLPLRKELRFRYKTSVAGLKAALRIAEDAGLVHKKGANLVAGPDLGAAPSSKGQVMVFANTASILQERQICLKFLASMEQHLSPFGVRIEPHLSWDFGMERGRFLPKITPDTRAIAILIPDLPQIANPAHKAFQSEIRKALGQRIPVVIFGTNPFPAVSCNTLFGPCPKLYLFLTNDFQAGEETASFALSLGHRNMAYFSFSEEAWNEKRCLGINRRMRTILGTAGKLVKLSANFDKTEIYKGSTKRGKPNREALERPIKSLMNGFTFSHPAYYDRIAFSIFESATRDAHWPAMEPLFEKALTDPDITAWVCADPNVAYPAMEFLERKNLRVPQDMHLMTIDDTPESIQRAITSQSFNWDRMGYLAAHAVLQDIPIRRKRNRVVICPQAVIDRGSVERV